jgi:type IV pilus biogenesis protein CpaD/CtpE
MKIKTIIASIALASLTACSGAQQSTAKAITDATGSACEFILQSTDPSLSPLCTTAAAVADAIEALISAAENAVTADAGAPAASRKLGSTYKPSAKEVYQYLATHGAKPAKF